MTKWLLYGWLLMLVPFSACNGTAQELTIVNNNSSEYKIFIPAAPSKLETRAAAILQTYLQRVTGMQLAIVNEKGTATTPGIYVGETIKRSKIRPAKLGTEGYYIKTHNRDLLIAGGSGKGLVYGVYAFIENYLHCRKISNSPAIVPTASVLQIPGSIDVEHVPQFIYRESYYPASRDAEYLEWNQLQQFEDLWGTRMWGHTYNKLVPVQTYFKTHPEYFAMVKGVRQPTQLCLSNEDVFKITVAELKKKIADNPDALYWSVSPNDDIGYCECDKCKPVDQEQGSPSGSLIKFVNRVAKVFPDKIITTLAYGYSHRAPKDLKPADNVYIFLSDIDAFRDKPLAEEGSAGAFRNDLKAWGALTPNIFVWDYVTQFTAYLGPFPNFHTLQPNMQYLKNNGVKGVFVQGSGDTYGEWAELRSYVIAKLLEDDKADVTRLISSFLSDYYGNAAQYLQQYIDILQAKMIVSKRKLDIYGNPVNEWRSYLTPELIETYNSYLDKAEAAVEGNPTLQERVMKVRLSLEYTVYQQARFYGIEKHGIFVKDDNGEWTVKPKLPEKIARFVANCKKANVAELSEGGRTPDQYQEEWNAIFKAGVTPTKAIGATVTLTTPFAEEYPAKGNRTLVDGNPGYTDFSYNWLCFYGVPMVATIDLGKPQKVNMIKMHFLDDPRHWIFLPEQLTVSVSEDGTNYKTISDIKPFVDDEHYDVGIIDFKSSNTDRANVRYIKVSAKNLGTLPLWRYKENKKPTIACDEVYVQ